MLSKYAKQLKCIRGRWFKTQKTVMYKTREGGSSKYKLNTKNIKYYYKHMKFKCVSILQDYVHEKFVFNYKCRAIFV